MNKCCIKCDPSLPDYPLCRNSACPCHTTSGQYENVAAEFDEKFWEGHDLEGAFIVNGLRDNPAKKLVQATAQDIKSFLLSKLALARKEYKAEVVKLVAEMKQEHPQSIKQEIWGGEGGLPNTKTESPDVFGIKYVDGWNAALQALKEKL